MEINEDGCVETQLKKRLDGWVLMLPPLLSHFEKAKNPSVESDDLASLKRVPSGNRVLGGENALHGIILDEVPELR